MIAFAASLFGQNASPTNTVSRPKVKNLGDTGTHEVGHRGTRNVTGGTIPVYRSTGSAGKRKKYANQEVSYRKKTSASSNKRKVKAVWDDTDIVHRNGSKTSKRKKSK